MDGENIRRKDNVVGGGSKGRERQGEEEEKVRGGRAG